MSLIVKCWKCGFELRHEIFNPGLIKVDPCEDCIQRGAGEIVMPEPNVAGGTFNEADGILAAEHKADDGPGIHTNETSELMDRQLRAVRFHRGELDDNEPTTVMDKKLTR